MNQICILFKNEKRDVFQINYDLQITNVDICIATLYGKEEVKGHNCKSYNYQFKFFSLNTPSLL